MKITVTIRYDNGGNLILPFHYVLVSSTPIGNPLMTLRTAFKEE